MAAGWPSCAAAWATASAKLPPDAATTPGAGTSAASIALKAPRGLNDPVCWSSSSFRVSAPSRPRAPGSRSRTGVSRTRPAIRAAAASISGRPTSSVVRSGEPVMVQRLVEHRFVDAALAGDLAQRPTRVGGLLDDLRGAVVADVRVERGRGGERVLGVPLEHLLVRLDAAHALAVEEPRGGSEQLDRVEQVAGDQRHPDVELELPLRAG